MFLFLKVAAASLTFEMMDDMAAHFNHLNKSATYNPHNFVANLTECMAKWDDDALADAADATWAGFLDFYQHPNASDPWVNCLENPSDYHCSASGYVEGRSAKYAYFGKDERKVQIMEPCNYASNMAFYHGALRACDHPNWKGSE